MNQLAKGWAEIELGEHVYIAGRIGWRGLKADEYKPAGPIFLSVPNLNHGDDVNFEKVSHISQARYEESPEIQLKVGDTLLVKDGAGIGKLGFVSDLPGPATVNSSLLVVRPTNGLLMEKYLFYYLKGPKFQEIALERITGSATPHLFQKDIKKLRVLVPPLPEQRRIVAKLEKLLSKVNACQERLAKIPVLLKRFRQSVLSAACYGRLTADWREENQEVEPATQQIKKERYQIAHDEVDLPELPDTWSWIALGDYALCRRGKFTPRPRNDPRYFGGKYPFIQIGSLPREGGLVTSHSQTLNDEGLSVSRKFPKGTVVIAIVGATIGNTGILAYDTCVTDSLIGIETGTLEGNRFVEFFLRHKKHDIRQASYSSGGQPNIKLDFLNPYPLALPPLAEQYEIVRRVETMFALADQIEARFANAGAQIDKLTSSLLAKAFRGELVPQDPNDEPAEKLLHRIKPKP